MSRKIIDPMDYTTDILKGVKKSALVTARRGDYHTMFFGEMVGAYIAG